MTLKELLDSLSFDEIAPFLIRHYHTIMRQEIWLLKSQLAACAYIILGLLTLPA